MGFIIECCSCHEKQLISNYEILEKDKIKVMLSGGEDGYAALDFVCNKCGNEIECDNHY